MEDATENGARQGATTAASQRKDFSRGCTPWHFRPHGDTSSRSDNARSAKPCITPLKCPERHAEWGKMPPYHSARGAPQPIFVYIKLFTSTLYIFLYSLTVPNFIIIYIIKIRGSNANKFEKIFFSC